MFKVNNKDTKTTSTPMALTSFEHVSHISHMFEHVSHNVLVFLLLTLNM